MSDDKVELTFADIVKNTKTAMRVSSEHRGGGGGGA